MAKRPQTLAEYIGQERAKRVIGLELANGATPRHTLVHGRAGLGKTSLAQAFAHDAGMTFIHWQATATMTPRKVMNDLFELPVDGYDSVGRPGPDAKKLCIFVDEVHAMHPSAFETWYSPLEDRELRPDPDGRVSWLPVFTLIAATTDPNLLPNPFAARFPVKVRLDPYSPEDLAAMVQAKFSISDSDALEVAKRSKGNARQAVDYAESVVRHGLDIFDLYEIDADGWTPLDRAVIAALNKAGRPLSLSTLAAMVRESRDTIRDIVEPALLAAGLMEITPQGRVACGILDRAASRGPLTGYAE
jgi:Holliday junction DNA helicase RuvB